MVVFGPELGEWFKLDVEERWRFTYSMSIFGAAVEYETQSDKGRKPW